ncbi:MAG: CRISPR-associated helicase Cas3' [Peptoniphilaceae bacterium]|nr:CRISPR-associated helicase Cas3' [Peptoniphilaceae bacterium]MDY6019203.1 CRISPR-associated helicase Cas3' [Anaerococcus sp.]
MEMSKYLWAKKEVGEVSNKWLSLYQHLIDTRDIGALLWENWLSQGQKFRISEELGFFDQDDSKKLFTFLCQIHDLGKATYNFQTTKTNFSTEDLEYSLMEKLRMAGFRDFDKSLSFAEKTFHALAGQMILVWNGFGEDLASIVGSHHGKPPSKSQIIQQKSLISNYYKVENPEDLDYKLWKKVQEEIIESALIDNGFENLKDLPPIPKNTQIILSALLIMADWIASNNNYFPLINIDEAEVINKDSRPIKAYEKWATSTTWQAEDVFDIENNLGENIFKIRFGFSPRQAQEKFEKVIYNTSAPGIFIFEAPMGMGKTESALIGVEELAYKTNRSGLFFGLPTQATSNAIFPRIEDWLEKIDADLDKKHGIRLAHGKASLNEDFISLSSNVNIDLTDKELENQTVVINEWFAGRKKTSLDDFVIGTVDQFLLMSLKQKHVALRHLGFDKKVVVIDEVHAYDIYMDQYLLESIRWLGSYQVPVILLSATLPAEKREEMLQAYLLGMGVRKTDIKEKRKNLSKDAYPLISYTDGEDIKQYTDFSQGQAKIISIEKYYSDDLLPLIEELSKKDGIIGVIVNTVKKSQELAEKCADIFGEDRVDLLHSNFIATQRAKKEKALLDMIGKGGKRPKKKIIIGTQVIEQSIDIDFDVLITDLAPMDLMIQRIGRLHRHQREDRPLAYKEPVVYVGCMNKDFDFEKGSLAVYGAYILARSQYYLPEKIEIPSDISKLVQKVYSDDKLDLSYELNNKYEDFLREDEVFKEKKKAKAKVYLLSQRKNRREKTMVDWLQGDAILKTEEKANAQVRDSNDTIEVIALKKIGKGYGIFGEDKDISERINENKIAKKIANNSLKLPTILSNIYNIDKTIENLEKYNLKYLKVWQDQAWLKGSLGIIFDENNEFIIGDFKLIYSEKYGLKIKKLERIQ